jgi:hypothetical protein
MRVGIAHHLGWAVAVTAAADHRVVDDIAVQRRVPYEARADSVMYRQVLAELARARGWDVHLFDARTVEGQAADLLAERADEILHGPRSTLGPPWAKDHRMALAATIVAG